MPFARGALLIASFSITWGVLAGINAVLLRTIVGDSGSVLGLGLSLGVAFLEALALMEVVDRFFLRARLNARSTGKSHDGATPENRKSRNRESEQNRISAGGEKLTEGEQVE
jgi:hypothetical protein